VALVLDLHALVVHPVGALLEDGEVALDQIRAVDKSRLAKRLGRLSPATQKKILQCLSEIFS
ncbi:MAG: type II toxin-antitoxin system PemK/MazF family toxin, partial [Bacteroidota bacterium]